VGLGRLFRQPGEGHDHARHDNGQATLIAPIRGDQITLNGQLAATPSAITTRLCP
jgi:hypothetical protein